MTPRPLGFASHSRVLRATCRRYFFLGLSRGGLVSYLGILSILLSSNYQKTVKCMFCVFPTIIVNTRQSWLPKLLSKNVQIKHLFGKKRHTKPLQNVSKIIFILPDLEEDPLNFLKEIVFDIRYFKFVSLFLFCFFFVVCFLCVFNNIFLNANVNFKVNTCHIT